MKLHPGVAITVDSADFDLMTSTTDQMVAAWDAFQKRMRPQLMSGEDAPDIANLGMLINLEKAADSGLFIDLYPFWNNDPDIIQEDYFQNVLKTNEYNGGLYAIPTLFNVNLLHLNKRVTGPLGIDVDAMSEISSTGLLDIYLRGLDEGVIGDDFWINYGDGGKSLLTPRILADYFDPKTKTARFDSPEFIEYLEKSNRLPTQHTVFTGLSTSGPDFEEDNNAFLMMNYSSFLEIDRALFSTPNTSAAILLTMPSGRVICTPSQNYAITNWCKNPELAWEFIKYCIMESEVAPLIAVEMGEGREFNGDRFYGWNPLNKNNFKKHLQACCLAYEVDYTEEIYQKYLSWAERISVPISDEGNEMGMLNILTQFYDQGLITAEECAKQLQERAEIYFLE